MLGIPTDGTAPGILGGGENVNSEASRVPFHESACLYVSVLASGLSAGAGNAKRSLSSAKHSDGETLAGWHDCALGPSAE